MNIFTLTYDSENGVWNDYLKEKFTKIYNKCHEDNKDLIIFAIQKIKNNQTKEFHKGLFDIFCGQQEYDDVILRNNKQVKYNDIIAGIEKKQKIPTTGAERTEEIIMSEFIKSQKSYNNIDSRLFSLLSEFMQGPKKTKKELINSFEDIIRNIKYYHDKDIVTAITTLDKNVVQEKIILTSKCFNVLKQLLQNKKDKIISLLPNDDDIQNYNKFDKSYIDFLRCSGYAKFSEKTISIKNIDKFFENFFAEQNKTNIDHLSSYNKNNKDGIKNIISEIKETSTLEPVLKKHNLTNLSPIKTPDQKKNVLDKLSKYLELFETIIHIKKLSYDFDIIYKELYINLINLIILFKEIENEKSEQQRNVKTFDILHNEDYTNVVCGLHHHTYRLDRVNPFNKEKTLNINHTAIFIFEKKNLNLTEELYYIKDCFNTLGINRWRDKGQTWGADHKLMNFNEKRAYERNGFILITLKLKKQTDGFLFKKIKKFYLNNSILDEKYIILLDFLFFKEKKTEDEIMGKVKMFNKFVTAHKTSINEFKGFFNTYITTNENYDKLQNVLIVNTFIENNTKLFEDPLCQRNNTINKITIDVLTYVINILNYSVNKLNKLFIYMKTIEQSNFDETKIIDYIKSKEPQTGGAGLLLGAWAVGSLIGYAGYKIKRANKKDSIFPENIDSSQSNYLTIVSCDFPIIDYYSKMAFLRSMETELNFPNRFTTNLRHAFNSFLKNKDRVSNKQLYNLVIKQNPIIFLGNFNEKCIINDYNQIPELVDSVPDTSNDKIVIYNSFNNTNSEDIYDWARYNPLDITNHISFNEKKNIEIDDTAKLHNKFKAQMDQKMAIGG